MLARRDDCWAHELVVNAASSDETLYELIVIQDWS